MRRIVIRHLERIVKRPDYLRIARARWNSVRPGLVLQASAIGSSANGPGPRVGYTVSKKVGNSVSRNRARRRLKSLVNDVFSERAEEAFDYVLIGRAKTLERTYDELLKDLRSALKYIHRMSKDGTKKTETG
jgi:ribonuclease P protein component